MAVQVTPYLITSKGGLTAVVIRPQSVAADGTFTDTGSAITVTGVIKTLNSQMRRQTEDIRPITSPRENNVAISDGFSIDLGVIKVDNGVDTDPLETAFRNYTYFSLTWTEGTQTGGKKTVKCYVAMTGRSDAFADMGQVIDSYSFACVDVGSTDFYKVTTS